MYEVLHSIEVPMKVRRRVAGNMTIQVLRLTSEEQFEIVAQDRLAHIIDPEGFQTSVSIWSSGASLEQQFGIKSSNSIKKIIITRAVMEARMFWKHYADMIKTDSMKDIAVHVLNSAGVYNPITGSFFVEHDGTKQLFVISDVDPIVKKRGLLMYGFTQYRTDIGTIHSI